MLQIRGPALCDATLLYKRLVYWPSATVWKADILAQQTAIIWVYEEKSFILYESFLPCRLFNRDPIVSSWTELMAMKCFFTPGHSLTQFVRHCAEHYLSSDHEEIRMEAVRTCSCLLTPSLRVRSSSFQALTEIVHPPSFSVTSFCLLTLFLA